MTTVRHDAESVGRLNAENSFIYLVLSAHAPPVNLVEAQLGSGAPDNRWKGN